MTRPSLPMWVVLEEWAMLNADAVYAHFCPESVPPGAVLQGDNYTIAVGQQQMTLLVSAQKMELAQWVARIDPMKGCSFLSKSGQLGVTFFYDQHTDQTSEAINDCKNMLIDV